MLITGKMGKLCKSVFLSSNRWKLFRRPLGFLINLAFFFGEGENRSVTQNFASHRGSDLFMFRQETQSVAISALPTGSLEILMDAEVEEDFTQKNTQWLTVGAKMRLHPAQCVSNMSSWVHVHSYVSALRKGYVRVVFCQKKALSFLVKLSQDSFCLCGPDGLTDR